MCAATGTSDHHTGLTCDLLDPDYGTSLDTDTYEQHIDWQWLYANSYKYGFIDRFPEAWAGGLMSEPLNVDENGSTGLFETWHYRYVGVKAATEIANGKYNNGNYDSLEHYLKALGLVRDLKNAECE
jgi:D-alanyl-D-alanine carboxypeptidase